VPKVRASAVGAESRTNPYQIQNPPAKSRPRFEHYPGLF
jgi:hypothetical protein